MSEDRSFTIDNINYPVVLGDNIDTAKEEGDVTLLKPHYSFICNSIHNEFFNTVSFTGNKKTRTVITVTNYMNINKEADVSFSNITFVLDPLFATDRFGGQRGFFNIKGKVSFNNCTFFGFNEVFTPLFNCLEDGVLDIKNTKFIQVANLLSSYGSSNTTIKNCKMDYISRDYIFLSDNSSLVLSKCKAFMYNQTFMHLTKNAKAEITECSLKGKYFERNSEDSQTDDIDIEAETVPNDKEKVLIGKEFEKRIANVAQTIYGIIVCDTSTLNLYKTKMENCNNHILAHDNCSVKVLECSFKDGAEGIIASEKSNMDIIASSVSVCEISCITIDDEANVNIYESHFSKCKGVACIYTGAKATAKLNDSVVEKNYQHGVVVGGHGYISINKTSFYDNTATAVYGTEWGSGSVTNSIFRDNGLFTLLIFENSNMSYEKNYFQYTKEPKFDFAIYIVGVQENGKGYFSNNHFIGKDNKNSGILAKDNGSVFVTNSTFKNLDSIADLFEESNVYLKDCQIKEIGENIAKSSELAQFKMVGCKVLSLFH